MTYQSKQVAGFSLTLVCALTFLGGCKGKTAVDDASLNTAIQARLHSDAGLIGQPMQVTVQDGVVTLSGTVGNEAARALAANDVAEVKGVRTVVNNLSVGTTPPLTASVPSQDPAPAARPVPPRSASQQRSESPARSYQPSAPAPVDRREPAAPTYAQQNQPAPQPSRPASPTFHNVTVPVGTGLSVRITQTLDSENTQPGAAFSGVLASDVIVDGAVAFPTGTRVSGRVDDAKDAGHFSGSSLLAISLTGISRRGEDLNITTDTFSKQGKGRGKNTAEKVGGGAAVGAILGGIFGGGKGAAIGAGAGGGLGAGANGVTRGEQVQIPSESLVRFRLTTPVTVRVSSQPDNESGSNDLRRRDQ